MISLVIKLLIRLQVSRTSPQNTLETLESETENTEFRWEILKERDISTEKSQNIIGDLGLI